jgi:hypothetical protein
MEYIPVNLAPSNAARYVRVFVVLDKWAGISQPARCDSGLRLGNKKKRDVHGKYNDTD